MNPSRSWLRTSDGGRRPMDGASALTLICVAHAGAGASSFARWPTLFGAAVTLARVQLPGREEVRTEKPLRRVADAIAGLGPDVMRLARTGPVALYGHSMGALVVYELARVMQTLGLPPAHVAVSGRRAPHLPASKPPIHHAPDDEFLAGLDLMAGAPVPRTHAYQRYALPIIRADLELGEEYLHQPDPSLNVPLSAFGGLDDPIVTAGEIGAWEKATTGPFRSRLLPGGHLFHQPRRAEIAEALHTDWTHIPEITHYVQPA